MSCFQNPRSFYFDRGGDSGARIAVEFSARSRYAGLVTAFLRYLGILNAAVWLGASVFLIIGLPAVFSDELKNKIGQAGPVAVGWAAQMIVARFFILQYYCGAIALAHLTLEWLYCGKPLLQRNLGLLLLLLGLALAGGLWMQPKLKDLHQIKYFGATQAGRDQAGRAFNAWHGASEFGNLAAVGGLLIYLWRVSRSGEHEWFGTLNLDKVRG